MKKKSENRKTLTWDWKGLGTFKAIIWDGELALFQAAEDGSQVTISSRDVEFLERLSVSIEELIRELNEK